ncbi:pyridoxal phosphate-dependent transferase [Radiomyces spectabilis]|uniref:pyridoxal phosphate-dependent transferase n=1 Tax=Radiomyces spectabilis TaxID=64574 RepID=UPI00221F19D7|nr:pyridoxal phosphate-dependent transferase [Radiomyces spectabilis]KAI8372742.1 pyridoxal phosphate-dependent transferase [Radiomyces spectabilis]
MAFSTVADPYGARLTAYDLTSDTATAPTDTMFDIMKAASRGDDVFNMDHDIHQLEAYMAKLLGQEAALFCVSGCMTNQLGLRCLLTQPPHSVLCDARSHVFLYECGGIAYHSQANVAPVQPANGIHLTVDDVKAGVVTDDLCGALTRVISLENTLNGTVMPLEAMQQISAFAREQGYKMHLDGARLWNASQATGVAMHEYGRLFDTVSVCLSKGVGAPIGSILAGSQATITRARHIRKLMGGGWRQAGCLAAAAKHCIDTVVPTMPETHRLAADLAAHLQSLGMRLLVPCHTNMVFFDTAPTGITIEDLAQPLAQKNIIISSTPGTTTRVVLHYQITPQAIEDFKTIATQVVQTKGKPVNTIVDPATPPMMADLKSTYPSANKTTTVQ